jgi:hypothetical protein
MESRIDDVTQYEKQKISSKTEQREVLTYHNYLVDRVMVYDLCKLLGLCAVSC